MTKVKVNDVMKCGKCMWLVGPLSGPAILSMILLRSRMHGQEQFHLECGFAEACYGWKKRCV